VTTFFVLLMLSSISVQSETCGSTAILRDEVRTRVGREPELDAPRFEVIITRTGERLEAKLTTDGTAQRTFSSSDCRELLESVALAISITLDPALLLGPTPAPAPAPARPAAPPVVVVSPTPGPPVVLSVALLGAAALGVAGPITPGGGLALGFSRGALFVGAEGRLDAPVALGDITAFATLGTISAGWQHRWVRLTVPVSLGALQVTGTGSPPTRDSRLLVLAGLEASFRWELATWFSLEPFVRAQLVATRITVLDGQRTAWVTWPVSLTAGLAVRFNFSLAQ
jgi:hypothetical protein